MYNIQCVFPLLALYVGLCVGEHQFSWDVVVGRIKSLDGSKKLEFYDHGKRTHSVKPSNDPVIEWLSYDPIHKRVLIFDKNASTDSVSSFYLLTKKTETLIEKKYIGDVKHIAYDPATELFFGFINKSLYSFFVKPGKGNGIEKKLVINLPMNYPESPKDIVVDSSCGGYIYWTNKFKIERVQFDGSKREVILDSNNMTRNALTIDPVKKKMYWIESSQKDETKYSILSADLNGKNIRTLYSSVTSPGTVYAPTGTVYAPTQLSVSKDFIYWGNRRNKFFWQLPSNPQPDTTVKPNNVLMDRHSRLGFQGIAPNYEIEEHTQGIPNCKVTDIDADAVSVSTEVSLLCVHGTKVSGKSRCECTQGYSGDRCDVSVCQNYCIHGNCVVSTEGLPKCSCKAGYSGAKCEVNACKGHCLNDGICSLDDDSEPVCQCTNDYEGDRCKDSIFLAQCPLKLNTDVKPVTLAKGEKSTSASQLPRMTVTWEKGASPK